MSLDSRLPDFRKLEPSQRLEHIAAKAQLTAEERKLLAESGALSLQTADGMIENVIAKFELPYAIAGYFQINGKDALVPMVVEEPSVVAAASYMAKLARENGGFQTSSSGPLMRAQVQVMNLSDPYGARLAILQHRQEIIDIANSRDRVLIGLG
ncbi:MAG: hydroxymethylglutaryl-CoA reductase, degradative, partial [Pollutimonas bauzanensis]